jgi:hypothetical protein
LSSRFIPRKLKIKNAQKYNFASCIVWVETLSLTLRKEHRPRVSEERMLSRIFGPKREEDGSWRKLHNDELHTLCSSSNIVRMIKSRRMRWHAWVKGEVFTVIWLGGPKVRDHWEDVGIGGRITLSWTLGR